MQWKQNAMKTKCNWIIFDYLRLSIGVYEEENLNG